VPLIANDVTGFDADTWFGLFAPRATPPALVQRIRDDVAAVIHAAPIRQKLIDIGGEPSGEQPDEFAARVRSEIDRWKEVARVAGIKPL
jgi:tripartite-type tricarboxylate transporter receptor subunit TctC